MDELLALVGRLDEICEIVGKLDVQQKTILMELYFRTERTEAVTYNPHDWFFEGEKLPKKDLSSLSHSVMLLVQRNLIQRNPTTPRKKQTCLMNLTPLGHLVASQMFFSFLDSLNELKQE